MSNPEAQGLQKVKDISLQEASSRPWIMGLRKRWWLFRPVDLLAKYWPVSGEKSGAIVIRMDGIGDMVLFRWSLDYYAEALGYRPEEITVVGCKSWAALSDLVFAGYKVHILDEHKLERSMLYRFRQLLAIKKIRPEVALLDMYFRKALAADSLVWASCARRKVVSKPFISPKTRAEFSYYMASCDQVVETGPYPTHEIIRHARYVSALSNQAIMPNPPRLPWRDTASPKGLDKPYVVLNFGSNETGRRWPLDKYIELGNRILELGLMVVFTGGKGEVEGEKKIFKALDNPNAINMIGKTSLPELVDLLSHAVAVVTGDTGPMHIALALETPTVAIVGGGHFGAFIPYPEEVKSPQASFPHVEMACYHCFWNCTREDERHPDGSFPCVAAVSVDVVWDDLLKLVERPMAGKPETLHPT